jgi:hypothetical protein
LIEDRAREAEEETREEARIVGVSEVKEEVVREKFLMRACDPSM